MFKIHNDRELVLLKFLYEECELYTFLSDDNIIGKINGIVSSLYMLEIIDSPLIIINHDEAYNLLNLINDYYI